MIESLRFFSHASGPPDVYQWVLETEFTDAFLASSDPELVQRDGDLLHLIAANGRATYQLTPLPPAYRKSYGVLVKGELDGESC